MVGMSTRKTAKKTAVEPGLRGFSAQNLWRMRQLFETYRDAPKLSPLVRVLPWTHNLIILGQSKRAEEREFYLRMAVQQRWGASASWSARSAWGLRAGGAGAAKTLTSGERNPRRAGRLHFKDAYALEFLELPDRPHRGRPAPRPAGNLGRFLIELGRDFCFVGSEFPVQVGGQDFALDLLFFHRGLNCLVAIELKVDRLRARAPGQAELLPGSAGP
jgi:predicted nuclease of restriction endonuclease-like (RecB) superfamily